MGWTPLEGSIIWLIVDQPPCVNGTIFSGARFANQDKIYTKLSVSLKRLRTAGIDLYKYYNTCKWRQYNSASAIDQDFAGSSRKIIFSFKVCLSVVRVG